MVAQTAVSDCEGQGDGVGDKWDGGDAERRRRVGVGGNRGAEELFDSVRRKNAAGIAGVGG